VGSVGTAYIDDFEATTTNIDVHYPSYWFLASTPYVFDESRDINQPTYNKNRAHLSWYTVDPIFGYPQTNTPAHIKNDITALSDHRTRIVYQDEIYPNRQEATTVDTKLPILNLSFYPNERGQYNISADQIGTDGYLTNPKQRWGGMMRRLDNTDFEKANIEYIEFWLMDPALTNPEGYDGEMYINLGDISEDILRDGKTNRSHAYNAPHKDAKEAKLNYEMIGCSDRYTLLDIELLTGRHHQIRCQLSKIGCPIKGDLKYGAKRSNPNGGISLHSRSLVFTHPVRKELVEIIAPVPTHDNLWKFFAENNNTL
jgi:cell surface protein SprA